MSKKKKKKTLSEDQTGAIEAMNIDPASVNPAPNSSDSIIAVEATTEATGELVEAAVKSEESSETLAPVDSEVSGQEGTVEAAAIETRSEELAAETNTSLVTDRTEIKRALEAMIFASPKAISARRIKSILTSNNFDVSGTEELLAEIEQDFSGRGFELRRSAGSWQFRTNPNQADVLQKLLEDRPVRLSPSALEVLAIVAYKQPVTRAEVDAVRGIDSSHLTRGLMEKNLIRSEGHAETPGRPLLFATTPQFLEIFGLDSLDDLPSTEEFEKELSVASGSDSDTQVMVGDQTELLATAAFHDHISGLPANPERGAFDEPNEESVNPADFGVSERALEEAQN